MDVALYPRRILLAVTGLSPQVVTETLYALAVSGKPPFLPTEVHLITTAEGAERAKLSLLHPRSGWFHRLLRDYGLAPVRFDEDLIHVISDADGQPLEDIRTPADNIRAADAISETVRLLTDDERSALHVSIAGGRKTMGFYLGYALSLFGRPQDRLSHVLVSAPYESHPQFYYPTPESEVIHTPQPDSRPYDTRLAQVTLADIPFVRLRDGLDPRLTGGRVSFSEAVAAAQRALGPAELVLDLAGGCIRADGRIAPLAPASLAFLAWHARRSVAGEEGVTCPSDGAPEPGYAAAYLAEYRAIRGEMGDDERTARRLAAGMDRAFFEQTKSRLHRVLKEALGFAAAPYLIKGAGRSPKRYGLGLPARRVHFGAVAPRPGA